MRVSSNTNRYQDYLLIYLSCFREGFVFIVCQREFCDFLLYLVTTPGIELDKVIQDKVLALIQSWALAYSSDKKLRGVAEVYMILKDKGIKFPEPSDEDLKDTEVLP